jgi:hypothetical protein
LPDVEKQIERAKQDFEMQSENSGKTHIFLFCFELILFRVGQISECDIFYGWILKKNFFYVYFSIHIRFLNGINKSTPKKLRLIYTGGHPLVVRRTSAGRPS